jgi:hypothetical protein
MNCVDGPLSGSDATRPSHGQAASTRNGATYFSKASTRHSNIELLTANLEILIASSSRGIPVIHVYLRITRKSKFPTIKRASFTMQQKGFSHLRIRLRVDRNLGVSKIGIPQIVLSNLDSDSSTS